MKASSSNPTAQTAVAKSLGQHWPVRTVSIENRRVVVVTRGDVKVHVAAMSQRQGGSAHVDRAPALCDLIDQRVSQLGECWLLVYWGSLPEAQRRLLAQKPYAVHLAESAFDDELQRAVDELGVPTLVHAPRKARARTVSVYRELVVIRRDVGPDGE